MMTIPHFHALQQHYVQLVSRCPVHLLGAVGVDIQGGTDIRVPEPCLHCFDVHAMLDHQGC